MMLAHLRKINASVKNFDQIRASVITHWVKIYNLRKAQHMAGHRYVSSTEDYKQQVLDESLEGIRAPALILTSDTKDRKSAARRYEKRLPDARVEVADTPVPIARCWTRLVEYLEG